MYAKIVFLIYTKVAGKKYGNFHLRSTKSIKSYIHLNVKKEYMTFLNLSSLAHEIGHATLTDISYEKNGKINLVYNEAIAIFHELLLKEYVLGNLKEFAEYNFSVEEVNGIVFNAKSKYFDKNLNRYLGSIIAEKNMIESIDKLIENEEFKEKNEREKENLKLNILENASKVYLKDYKKYVIPDEIIYDERKIRSFRYDFIKNIRPSKFFYYFSYSYSYLIAENMFENLKKDKSYIEKIIESMKKARKEDLETLLNILEIDF